MCALGAQLLEGDRLARLVGKSSPRLRVGKQMIQTVAQHHSQGLDHGTGHLAPLRSTLRLAVVDSEALEVDQRMSKSPQTSTAVSDRKTAPLRSSHLRA